MLASGASLRSGSCSCVFDLETVTREVGADMIRRGGVILGTLILALGLSGCTTFVSLLEPNSPKIFGGTRMSLDAHARASSGETPAYGWTWYPLMLIDLPLSVVIDTALLPVTILMEPDEESLNSPRAARLDARETDSEGE